MVFHYWMMAPVTGSLVSISSGAVCSRLSSVVPPVLSKISWLSADVKLFLLGA